MNLFRCSRKYYQKISLASTMHPLSRNGKKAWNHAARPACRRRTTMPSASRGASDCNQHMTCIHGFHGFLCFMLSSDSSPVIMPHFAALRKSLPRPRACAREKARPSGRAAAFGCLRWRSRLFLLRPSLAAPGSGDRHRESASRRTPPSYILFHLRP